MTVDPREQVGAGIGHIDRAASDGQPVRVRVRELVRLQVLVCRRPVVVGVPGGGDRPPRAMAPDDEGAPELALGGREDGPGRRVRRQRAAVGATCAYSSAVVACDRDDALRTRAVLVGDRDDVVDDPVVPAVADLADSARQSGTLRAAVRASGHAQAAAVAGLGHVQVPTHEREVARIVEAARYDLHAPDAVVGVRAGDGRRCRCRRCGDEGDADHAPGCGPIAVTRLRGVARSWMSRDMEPPWAWGTFRPAVCSRPDQGVDALGGGRSGLPERAHQWSHLAHPPPGTRPARRTNGGARRSARGGHGPRIAADFGDDGESSGEGTGQVALQRRRDQGSRSSPGSSASASIPTTCLAITIPTSCEPASARVPRGGRCRGERRGARGCPGR